MWRSASGADGLLVTTTLVAGVIVAAVAVHPEHHDKDSDAPQSTQDGEGLEHSRSPRSDYFEQKLTLRTIATLGIFVNLAPSARVGLRRTEARRLRGDRG